jgi:hypothetical protein
MRELGNRLHSFIIWNTVGMLIVFSLFGLAAGAQYVASGSSNAGAMAFICGIGVIAWMVLEPTSVRIYEGGIAIHKLTGDQVRPWAQVTGVFLGNQHVASQRGVQYAVQVTFTEAPPLVLVGGRLIQRRHCSAIAEAVCQRAGLQMWRLPDGGIEGRRPG